MRIFAHIILAAAFLTSMAARGETARKEAIGGVASIGAENARPAHAADPAAGAYRRHASLALFSLGSLAVGGVFYGIEASLNKPNVDYIAGDRTRLSTAAGAAGFTALIAAGSYFYFVREDVRRARYWDAGLSAVPASGGGLGLMASIRLPMP